jgi:hypothetical protein
MLIQKNVRHFLHTFLSAIPLLNEATDFNETGYHCVSRSYLSTAIPSDSAAGLPASPATFNSTLAVFTISQEKTR